MVKNILILSLFFFIQNTLSSQQGWELVIEKDDILIYTSKADFGLNFVKANFTINASISRILETINDHSNYVKWSHNCLESEPLERTSETESYIYSLTDAPWPVSSRDNVTRQKIYYLADGSVKIELEDFPNKISPKEGVVRVPYLKGYWLLKPINATQTSIEYFLHASAGGNIPDWLANSAVTDSPFRTLKAFRKVVEE